VSAKLLDRQMRSWEAARQLRQSVPEQERPEVEDFIYVSRQVGAGGREVAVELNRRLEWALFDQELLHAMAGDDDVRCQLYESMDERDLSWFEEALRAWTDPSFARNDYFHQLTRTVLTIARQGHAIFLGRGAGFLLPAQIGFRVRIVAPVEFRLARFSRVTRLGPEEAREEMERLDQERADFVWTHFHKNVDDPLLYDLTLNMAKLTPADAAEATLAFRRTIVPGA